MGAIGNQWNGVARKPAADATVTQEAGCSARCRAHLLISTDNRLPV